MIIQKERGLDSFLAKNYNDIPKVIADELNLPTSLVDSVVKGFYTDLRAVVSNGEATKIHLRRFGTKDVLSGVLTNKYLYGYKHTEKVRSLER